MSTEMTADELKLATMLLETLAIDDVAPEEIVPDAYLFGSDPDSLGLDSIDALEIAQAIAQQYDVHIRADDEKNKEIFRSLRSLNNFVQESLAS